MPESGKNGTKQLKRGAFHFYNFGLRLQCEDGATGGKSKGRRGQADGEVGTLA